MPPAPPKPDVDETELMAERAAGQGLGFRVQDVGFSVQGSGSAVKGLGFMGRCWTLGVQVWGFKPCVLLSRRFYLSLNREIQAEDVLMLPSFNQYFPTGLLD